jgi:hypothetical protein
LFEVLRGNVTAATVSSANVAEVMWDVLMGCNRDQWQVNKEHRNLTRTVDEKGNSKWRKDWRTVRGIVRKLKSTPAGPSSRFGGGLTGKAISMEGVAARLQTFDDLEVAKPMRYRVISIPGHNIRRLLQDNNMGVNQADELKIRLEGAGCVVDTDAVRVLNATEANPKGQQQRAWEIRMPPSPIATDEAGEDSD